MSKFDKIIARRGTLTPLSEIPRAASPGIKAAMKAERFKEDRPAPRRRFEGLTGTEKAAHSGLEWPMWVIVDGPARSRKLWSAPDKATWIATNHNDPAPSDNELLAAGWRKQAGAPIESGATD